MTGKGGPGQVTPYRRVWPPGRFILASAVVFLIFETVQLIWLFTIVPHPPAWVPTSIIIATVGTWFFTIRPVRRRAR